MIEALPAEQLAKGKDAGRSKYEGEVTPEDAGT